ncbi:MAG: metallophosphoesterase [Cryobacterium sp.]|nr:metallophosphoesterase [Oligoflexia bacterium]
MLDSTVGLVNPKRFKLVVSDFHLGKGRYFKDGTQNILEDFIYDREFSEFLAYYRTGEYADAEVELILNGDILNLLQIDYYGVHTHLFTDRSQVYAVQKIISGHPEFFMALRRWASTPGHTIAYVIGNHDVGMIFPGAQKTFSGATGSEVRFYPAQYVFDGVWIEHGQQYERFARLNLEKPFITRGMPEPVLDLPWGSLFVAVFMPKLKQQRAHLDKVRPFGDFMVWSILHDFWWAVKAGIGVVLFTLQSLILKTRYQIRKGVSAPWNLWREITLYPAFDKIAFKILDDQIDVNVVIFGHTHVLAYRQYREGKEYFNEGTWNEVTNLHLSEYGTKTRLTYAFIEYPIAPENGVTTRIKPIVRLKEWKGIWRPELEITV